ncbi:Alpha/beta hydrolase family protein [Aspergillus niger]|uniref:Alpha/beta hydrolase family protein n=1 Tax=Aspergillus niger TaxID=5061 RepID=A0A505I672_ASPNG|nr:Alpha/beta hydrolase family protein [Aspergillus niger]
MAALFFATHLSTPQSQLWSPSFSSPGHQPQSLQITRKNAQFILPTDACVHVGNLSSGVCPEILRHELEQLFFQFGTCWAQVREGKTGLFSGWVQFTERSHAQAAIRQHQNIFLRGRALRVQAANGLRNRVETMVHREERAELTTSPLYMPSMAIPSCQPIAYEPAMMYNLSPALPGYGSLYIPPPRPPPPASGTLPPLSSCPTHHTLSSQAPNAYTPQSSSYTSSPSSNTLDTQPTTPGCDGVVACEADQVREEEYIKDNRSNLPCDMLLSTGRTVRDYVDEMKRLRGIDLSDDATRELILELEEEARDQGLLPALTSKPD